MENIFDSTFRKDFSMGYSNGTNPFFDCIETESSIAFHFGFIAGRVDYENRNGRIIDGIPFRIVTQSVLEDFQLAGLLGLPTDTEGYTNYQLNVLSRWYQKGIANYDPKYSMYLFDVLEKNGIKLLETYCF